MFDRKTSQYMKFLNHVGCFYSPENKKLNVFHSYYVSRRRPVFFFYSNSSSRTAPLEKWWNYDVTL